MVRCSFLLINNTVTHKPVLSAHCKDKKNNYLLLMRLLKLLSENITFIKNNYLKYIDIYK